MENIKQERLVIFKTILLTAISAIAGYDFYIHFFVSIDNVNFLNNLYKLLAYWGIHDIECIKSIEYFVKGVPYYFFLYILVALSQWILFSEKLPQKWLAVSFFGAIVAGLLASVSRNLIFIPKDSIMELKVDFLNGCFLVGFLAAMPQWLLLRKRWEIKSYYWLAISIIGWGIVGIFLKQETVFSFTFGFGKVRVMIFNLIRYYSLWYIVDFCSSIPLGLGLGLFFTQVEMKKRNANENNAIKQDKLYPSQESEQENAQA